MTYDTKNNKQLMSLLQDFISKHKLPQTYLNVAQKWFIPLAEGIYEHQSGAGKPILLGVNGCQGSGKSTVTDLLVELLTKVYALPSIGFSIDDFYLSKAAREELAATVHPLFLTRGVPGTHDISLLNTCIEQLLKGEKTTIPSFDKSIDDLHPKSEWREITNAPLVIILEGWCVGIEAQNEESLIEPINELETLQDKDGKWRCSVNSNLAKEYKEAFSKIDYQIMLKAPYFKQVYDWRCEQEHKLIKALEVKNANKEQTKGIMTDQQIMQFIQYYQRLTEHALTSMPTKCDSLYLLDSTRRIIQCLQQ